MTNAEIFYDEIVPRVTERFKLGFGLKREIQLFLMEDGRHITANGEQAKLQITDQAWLDLWCEIKGITPRKRLFVLSEIIVAITNEVYLELSISAIKRITSIFCEALECSDIAWDGEYRFPPNHLSKEKWGIKIGGFGLPLDEPLNIEIPNYIDKKFVTKLLLKGKS